MLTPLLTGFATGGSLIVAIGAQNAFVIKQGLLRRHLFLTAGLCSLIDATLIAFGVLGFGQIISDYPSIIELSKYFAVAFLLFYGAISLRSAFANKALESAQDNILPTIKGTILMLLAFSLLNPHVYLDTVILLGSIASQHPEHEQLYFALGAISASFAWFFSITYGSRLLSPLLRKPGTWKVIDGAVALIMWGIAIALLADLS